MSDEDASMTTCCAFWGGDSCNAPWDGWAPATNNTDCNDADPTICPTCPETCGDGVDNDCDGGADNGCAGPDTDGDGVNDDTDNCDFVTNPLQGDVDGDYMGDACDPDADNDDCPEEDECDDLDDRVCGSFEETCGDGVDNDCDSSTADVCPDCVVDGYCETWCPPPGIEGSDPDCCVDDGTCDPVYSGEPGSMGYDPDCLDPCRVSDGVCLTPGEACERSHGNDPDCVCTDSDDCPSCWECVSGACTWLF